VWKSKSYGAFVLNHRVVLHAVDAMPARWRGDAGSSPLDRARTAAHPTHWLISTQVANYCLCQRCWPFGHAKSPFKTKEDYMDALLAHHAVMTAAMKAKQAVEPSASAALKHAVEDAVKMYVPL
jgi:hypothetical protein